MTALTHTARLMGYREPPVTAYEITVPCSKRGTQVTHGFVIGADDRVKRQPATGLHLGGMTLVEVLALCQERGWTLERCR